MKRIFSSFFLIGCLLFSCSNPPYRGSEVLGADEFVIDSYKIREGKFGILSFEGRNGNHLDPQLLEEYSVRIANGDAFHLSLFHPTRSDLVAAIERVGAKGGFVVENNMLTLPSLKPIPVVGLTLAEVKQRIQKRYLDEIDDIEVFLSFAEQRSKKVEIVGAVHLSNIDADGRKRLFDVIAQARIPQNANFFKSYIERDGNLLPVDMKKLIVDGDMSQNIVVKGGDKIFIAPSQMSSIMVMGEVKRPGSIDIASGSISIKEALAKVGGIPFTGDKSYIQVIRGSLISPKIYTLHWKHIVRLPNSSMLLMPGDMVYVAATPIAEWNRFVTQIFPTITAVEIFTKGVSGVVAVQ